MVTVEGLRSSSFSELIDSGAGETGCGKDELWIDQGTFCRQPCVSFWFLNIHLQRFMRIYYVLHLKGQSICFIWYFYLIYAEIQVDCKLYSQIYGIQL